MINFFKNIITIVLLFLMSSFHEPIRGKSLRRSSSPAQQQVTQPVINKQPPVQQQPSVQPVKQSVRQARNYNELLAELRKMSRADVFVGNLKVSDNFIQFIYDSNYNTLQPIEKNAIALAIKMLLIAPAVNSDFKQIEEIWADIEKTIQSLPQKQQLSSQNKFQERSGYGGLPEKIVFDLFELDPYIVKSPDGTIDFFGWHHDFGRKIEKNKKYNEYDLDITVNNNKLPSDCYRLNWGIHGSSTTKSSTFFPSTWTRYTVRNQIVEAYDEARTSQRKPLAQNNGNFSVDGVTKERLTIKMIITPQGDVITAYPVFPKN